MVFRKVKGSQILNSVNFFGISSLSGVVSEDSVLRFEVFVWDIFKVVLYVVDAVLTVCFYGRRCFRDLVTGLCFVFFLFLLYQFALICDRREKVEFFIVLLMCNNN